jgi:hypothetical protein
MLERHDASPVDKMILLIALGTVDATKVTRVDRFDREEDGLAPDALTLEEVTDSGRQPIQVSEVLHAAPYY